MAACQVATTHGFAALPDLARFENPVDLLAVDEASSTGTHRVRGWKISWPAYAATSTPDDDRQTRLDADQLRTRFEVKTAEARKRLGVGVSVLFRLQ